MTNAQAQAYAELAMREAGIDEDVVLEIVNRMYGLFDMLTEQEAQRKAKY